MSKKFKEHLHYFPHDFNTSINFLEDIELPKIVINEKAYMDMIYITSQSNNNEISWLGSVDKVNNVYIIDNIYLFEQTVSSTTTLITPNSIVKLGTEMLKAGMIKEVNKLRFWGHLHPGNSTSPSKDDNDTMDILRKRCKDYFIRGIFGRKGKAEFSLFDYSKGIWFNDVEWNFYRNENVERRDVIKKLIEEKVKKEIITFPSFGGYWQGETEHDIKDHIFKQGHYYH